MNSKLFTIAAITIVGLAGCVPSETAKTAPVAKAETPAQKGDIIFNYSSKGTQYKIHARYDTWIKVYGVELTRLSGGSFSGDTSEDAVVQNTIRDAFRSRKICKDGLHPGITQWNYGFIADRGTWGAKVRCSEVQQKNI